MSVKEGSFSLVRGKKDVDFWKKIGFPADEVKLLDGTHWFADSTMLGAGKWLVVIMCKELPEFNSVDVIEEGTETAVDSPAWGGKAKVKCESPDANTFTITAKTEKYGTWISQETYTDNGINVVLKGKESGATVNEIWAREVNEEGDFRYIGSENAAAYNKAMGITDNMEKLMEGARLSYDHLGGDSWCFSETIGGVTSTFKCNMDEEFDYSVPGWKRKAIMTRLAPGKVKYIMKAADGRIEEWVKEVDAKGNLTFSGLDKKTGTKCRLNYERFTRVDGTYKLAASHGMDAIYRHMGMDAEMAKSAANDYDATYTTVDKGGYFHVFNDSKFLPMNLIYKLDEEFDVPVPGGEPMKGIETASGDVYTWISRGPKFTSKMITKVTKNYMISDATVMGTSLKGKIVYARC